MLIDRLRSSFDTDVRARGLDYVSRVLIRHGDDEEVVASVRGTHMYTTTLTAVDGDRLRASCSCPYFADIGPCKHLWATAMAADAKRFLRGMKTRIGPIELILSKAEGDDDDDDLEEEPVARWKPRTHNAVKKKKKGEMPWGAVEGYFRAYPTARPKTPPQIVYLLEQEDEKTAVHIEVARRTVSKSASAPWVPLSVTTRTLDACDDPDDKTILGALLGESGVSYGYYAGRSSFRVPESIFGLLLPILVRTGRFGQKQKAPSSGLAGGPLVPLTLATEEHHLALHVDADNKGFVLRGEITCGERVTPFDDVTMISSQYLLSKGSIATIRGAGKWPLVLRAHNPIRVQTYQWDRFLQTFYTSPERPPLVLPKGHELAEVDLAPTPHLRVEAPKNLRREVFAGDLSFLYEELSVPEAQSGSIAPDLGRRRLVRRDLGKEREARKILGDVGFSADGAIDGGGRHTIAKRHFAKAIRALLAQGFKVEASGKLFRSPGAFKARVSTGIDWFELQGALDYEGVSADLGALLDALKRGDDVVVLGDGSMGLLPEAWMKKIGMFAALGKETEGRLRFSKGQASVLDALIAAEPEIDIDKAFKKARDQLRKAEGVPPADAPKGFVGELRGYQREGLGWLMFLERSALGGCLADDMGLGKTVQVLALLASHLPSKKGKNAPKHAPSLVVAPRSLIFNWKSEAERFVPSLRVLDHTGAERLTPGEHFEGYDLVLTTYGTLRRDAAALAGVEFRFVILDEAQAIKNADSESAKAARALRAEHRLALTGTPVENHLGELWSLFEFLNPGMLGRSSLFQAASGKDPDPALLAALARALRPFLLRRTKAQVAKDLPTRTEETLKIPLEPKQRKFYDNLRDHYRISLNRRIAEEGLAKSKIVVLEALLRLRQAALHPALVDKKRFKDPSAKLDALMSELPSLVEKGHKALVFSQFTSLLSFVKAELYKHDIAYEYLDGDTVDRKERVDRFQSDKGPPVFLVSLKAGGVGLNLTAAEYVFLLDPWWNPAVEAQAIDRTHRIGQTKPVFAYRLIAEGTIEERIVELQAKKRDLAEQVIAGGGGLLRSMTAEDLELLLS